jgi:hypothetical protein
MMNKRTFFSSLLVITLVVAGVYLALVTTSKSQSVNNKNESAEPASIADEVANLPVDTYSKTEPAVDRAECFTQFNHNQTPDLLLQAKSNYIIAFLRHLSSQGYSHLQVNYIGDIAGLNNTEISLATSGQQMGEQDQTLNEILLADNFQKQTEMPSDHRNKFDGLLAQKNYQGLIEAFNQQAIDPTHIRFGDSLLSLIIEKDHQISVAQVEPLLAAGMEIHMDAIVAATKWGSADIAKYFADSYSGNLKNTWQFNGMSTNLTMTAAAHFRDDLFFYFADKGIDAYVDNGYEYSMLFDVMPEPVTDDEKQRALRYVTDALQHNARTLRVSSIARLKQWLPENIQQEYHALLVPAFDVPLEIMESGERLKDEITLFNAKIQAAKQLQSACVKQHNYEVGSYLEELLQGNPNSATMTLATKALLTKHVDELVKKEWQKAAANQSAQTEVNTANTLDAQERFAAITAIHNATMDKQWDKALALCSTHPRVDLRQFLCSDLLSSYAHEELANWSFMERVLPHVGERLHITNALAMHNRVDLIKKLMPYGLQLDSNDYNSNALSWAIRMGNNTEAIALLLDNGVRTKPEFPGLDSLDVGLAEMDRFNAALKRDDGSAYFTTVKDISLLIKAGAAIERSHIEKIQQLKTLNPEAYQALIAALPELSAY